MVRRSSVPLLLLALLWPLSAPAQPGSLERSECTGERVDDLDLLRCLGGDVGPLTADEREGVRAHLRAAADARWDRVEQLLWPMLALPDPADRALVLELFVAHGMPRGAADAVLGMGDPAAVVASLRRRAPRRDRAALGELTIRDCRVLPETATATEVTIDCDRFVECGPRACMETHVGLRFTVSAAGPRLVSAGRGEMPSGGGCGCCIDEDF